VALTAALAFLAVDSGAAPPAPVAAAAAAPTAGPGPLSPSTKLVRYSSATGTKIVTGGLGEANTVTPRQLWLSSLVHAKVEHGTVMPAEGAAGVASMEAKSSSAPIFDPTPRVTLTFKPLANKMYILDCSVDNSVATFSTGVGSAPNQTVSSDGGHVIIVVPKQPTAASLNVTLMRTGMAAFNWYGCEITPVN
jgi:hypothetical protein